MLVYLGAEDTTPVSRVERTVFPTRASFMAGTSWPACSAPPRSFGDYLKEELEREQRMRQQQLTAPRMPPRHFRAARTSSVDRTIPILGKTCLIGNACASADIPAIASSTNTCS